MIKNLSFASFDRNGYKITVRVQLSGHGGTTTYPGYVILAGYGSYA